MNINHIGETKLTKLLIQHEGYFLSVRTESGQHVCNMFSENTGGGCMVDNILLPNGKLFQLSDECLLVHDVTETDLREASYQAWERENGKAYYFRLENLTDSEPMRGMSFVQNIEVNGDYLTIIHTDGHLINIDAKSAEVIIN